MNKIYTPNQVSEVVRRVDSSSDFLRLVGVSFDPHFDFEQRVMFFNDDFIVIDGQAYDQFTGELISPVNRVYNSVAGRATGLLNSKHSVVLRVETVGKSLYNLPTVTLDHSGREV